ncbi:uncharacterized protein LOC131145116 [Malania oleifera]|uniref:uncharacterized protein LOC131145116 n=1 Tax=Malania oleifera TaxID=397392 RepID=UPI0025AE7971|nr:uncharacterized protein LOC131145116 [Malania oleifera]
MASTAFKIHLQSSKTANPPTHFPINRSLFKPSSFPAPKQWQHQEVYSCIPLFTQKPAYSYRPKVLYTSLQFSLPSPTPPTSKDEAILQAKTCLSTTLEKPLNNPKLTSKLKKIKQPRFRVEIPVVDDSPSSISALALDVFGDIAIKRKGSSVRILMLWPNPTFTEAAVKAFDSVSSSQVQHMDVAAVTSGNTRILNSADVAVFLAPEASQLAVIKTITQSLYPTPVVVFNPRWGYEEESDFGELKGFVQSFEVVYSFAGLEVRGIVSKRKGVIFKCLRDGVLSGERWAVLVEEGGELKVVSRFKARPSIGEVENVLYNLMAINSPITKSAKFLRDLVSNVTGKK